METGRHFDMDDRVEAAIREAIGDEGFVLCSERSGQGGWETHLVAVVAGREGPQVACAAGGLLRGGGVHVGEGPRIPLEAACATFAHAGTSSPLDTGDAADAAVMGLDSRQARVLWRAARGNRSFYLLRTDLGERGRGLAAVSASRTDAEGEWSAEAIWTCPADSLLQQAIRLFGDAPRAAPSPA